MGSAQSQSSRKPRGSIAHPAVSTTLKIGTISILKVMADFLGRLQRADTGISAADCEVGLCGVLALSEQDPDCDANGRNNRAPIGEASTKAREQHGQDGTHAGAPGERVKQRVSSSSRVCPRASALARM